MRVRIQKRWVAHHSLLLLAIAAGTGAAPRVVNLGASAQVNGLAVLPDGTAVLAGGNTVTNRPLLWSISKASAVTTTQLTGPGGAPRVGIANGISPDGNYIAGTLFKVGAPLFFQTDGAIWTRGQPTAPTIVPDRPAFFPSTSLSAVSNNKVAVGVSAQDAYGWSSTLGGVSLPTVDSSASWAFGVSANGSLIVGTALDDETELSIAVTWTSGQYAVLDNNYSSVSGVSPNGRYIVGASDVVDDELTELDAVFWDNGQRHALLDAGAGLNMAKASWATDSGIIGGYSGPAGDMPVDGWMYFQGMNRTISFDTWWRQITGTTFPVEVTSVTAAAEYGGDLYLVLNEGTYFASVLWAAPADANRDRIVDGAEYTIWADNYLEPFAKTFEQGDFNGDQIVDGGDYTIWADYYTQLPVESFTATPEPATAVLLLLGGGFWLLLVRGWRRGAG